MIRHLVARTCVQRGSLLLRGVKSQQTAELDYLMGDCASFAVALQREIGGELYALYRNGKALHTFVRVGDRNFDVKGPGTLRSMVRSLIGSMDTTGWEIKGPFTQESQPCQKTTPKKIDQASEYIKVHRRKYT